MSDQPRESAKTTGDDAGAETATQVVLRQTLFRAVNERIEGVGEQLDLTDSDQIAIVCECGNARCAELIDLSQADYEHVRRHPTHFFVKLGHDLPDVERIVESKDGFLIVEKFGEGGALAVRHDPRRRRSSERAAS